MTQDQRRFFDWKYTQDFCNQELTTYEDKARLYSAEPAFRESLHALADAGKLDSAALGSLVRTTSIGIFRPDAIAHGKIPDALAYFARLGIRPVHCTTTQVTGHAVREVWRYQLKPASGERIRLLDLLFEASPSILVVFAADTELPVPCSALMADSKGEANPDDREGWELRSHLDSPNRIEVYMHIADEPADVVRDGGIVLGPDGFAAAMLADRSADLTAEVIGLGERIDKEYGEAARDCELSGGLLGSELARIGERSEGTLDRWHVLRSLGAACTMIAGPRENIISHSGTDAWWDRAGLLADRSVYLSSQ
ncbi:MULTISPECIES: hypothetical protein [unclassified Streptomyces]|uniref:hypothetical protein n=1 Tax=unclassified Streptomyces TaxID=2593676 RepID=UPI003243ED8E